MSALNLQVRGCRGSMSVSGDEYRRYGGNTTCFTIEVEPDHHLVVDCGTGLRSLQHAVSSDRPQRFTILLTHYHWDHIQGLPVFLPLFSPENTVTIHGPRFDEIGVRRALGQVMCPPWWPVSLEEAAASVSLVDLSGDLEVGPVAVSHAFGSHPQGVVAYRLRGPSRSVAIATDHEAGDGEADARVSGLAAGVDVLVHDAQYSIEEIRSGRRGRGHSTPESAVRAVAAAGATRLVLTSHDPDRTDAGVDGLRGVARAVFPNTDAAYEGMSIPL